MQPSGVGISYDRSAAAVAVILLHVAAIVALSNAIPKFVTHPSHNVETTIPLAPIPKDNAQPRRPPRGIVHSTVTSPYAYKFNPIPDEAQPNINGLSLALTSCAPEKLGNATAEIRAVCQRLGAAIVADPGALGFKAEFEDGDHWQRELDIKQAPFLLPCASPHPPPPGMGIVSINLGTLLCIADIIANGYHSEKVEHYTK